MPVIAANLIIENSKLLMLYRKDKGYWELPAGKVEERETAAEAAEREAREEIGVEVAITEEWEKFQVEMTHEGRKFYTRGFRSRIVKDRPKTNEEINLAPNLEMIQGELVRLLRNQ